MYKNNKRAKVTYCSGHSSLSLILEQFSIELSVEINYVYVLALVLLYCAIWLVSKTLVTLLTNEQHNQKQSELGCMRLSALGALQGFLFKQNKRFKHIGRQTGW